MRKTQVMTMVLLPQAVKIMLPAIISQCVVALKDTSLGYAIGAPGLTRVGKSIYTEFFNQIPTVIVVAVLYIADEPRPHRRRDLGAAALRRATRSRSRCSPSPTDAGTGLAPEARGTIGGR